MAIDPATYLELAKELKAQPAAINAETRYRTGVGRAYYAAFLVLLERIREAQGRENVPEGGVHGRVRGALWKSNATHLKQIKGKLGTMADARDEADYQPDEKMTFTESDLEAQIVRATKLIESILLVPEHMLENLKF